ncbi:MAG: hypothetical protein AAGH40_11185, partial [Verrucomicrobiota bacterium]
MRLLFFFFPLFTLVLLIGASPNNEQLLIRLLEKHSDLYARAQDAHRLSSISIDGIQTQGEETFDFLIWKKRPNQFRYRLSGANGDVVCGYDGKNGWQRTLIKGVVELTDLEGEELATIREESLFDGPLTDFRDKPYNKYRLVENPDFRGVQSNTIEVLESNGRRTQYTLGMGSGYILKRSRLNENGEVSLETYYSDYRMIDGFPFAYVIENRIDGELINRTE